MLLSAKNLNLHVRSRKLAPKYIGPLLVRAAIGSQAYRLQLLPSYKVHDVFHVSLLKPYEHREGMPLEDVQAPEIEGDNEAWEVESVLNDRTVNGQRQYLVRWAGYSPDWDQWEPEENLEGARDLVRQYNDSKAPLRRSKRRKA